MVEEHSSPRVLAGWVVRLGYSRSLTGVADLLLVSVIFVKIWVTLQTTEDHLFCQHITKGDLLITMEGFRLSRVQT